MNKEKLGQLLDNYSEYLKKYGVYLLLILFIFTLTLSFMLNKIKPAADNDSPVAENKPPVTSHQSLVTNVPLDTENNSPVTSHQSPVTKAPLGTENNSPVTSHQSPVTNAPPVVENNPPVTSHQSPVTNVPLDTENNSPVTSHQSPVTNAPLVAENKPPVTSHQSPVTNLNWPVQGEVITSYGLAYSQTYGDYRLHPGIDISTQPGDSVYAAAVGKVVAVVNNPGVRIAIEIEHGKGWITYYSHLTQSLVEEGQSVKEGQEIGQAGAPGTEESDLGSHLHFCVKEKDQWTDPLKYLKE